MTTELGIRSAQPLLSPADRGSVTGPPNKSGELIQPGKPTMNSGSTPLVPTDRVETRNGNEELRRDVVFRLSEIVKIAETGITPLAAYKALCQAVELHSIITIEIDRLSRDDIHYIGAKTSEAHNEIVKHTRRGVFTKPYLKTIRSLKNTIEKLHDRFERTDPRMQETIGEEATRAIKKGMRDLDRRIREADNVNHSGTGERWW